jgi:hypothetical protein
MHTKKGGRALYASTNKAVQVFSLVMPCWELSVPVFAVSENFIPSKVGKQTHLNSAVKTCSLRARFIL